MTSLFKNLSKDPESVCLDIKSDEEVVISHQPSEVLAYTNKGNIYSDRPTFCKALVTKVIDDTRFEKINISVPSVCQYTEYITNDTNNSRIINKTFPNIYLISLLEDENKKRLIHTKYVLKKLGANYTICFMSRPSEDLYTDYLKGYAKLEELNSTRYSYQKLSKNELGCLLSHHWVLKNLENTDIKKNIISESNLSLILEDDIMPQHDFDNCLKQILDHTPEIINGKIMMLASTDYHIGTRDIKNGSYLPTGDRVICGAGAYALNSESAKIISNEMSYYLKPADHYFNTVFNTIVDKKEGFVVYPPLIWLDISQSTIGNQRILDSDEYNLKLSRCYPGLNLDNYDLFPLQLLEDNICIKKIQNLLVSDNFIQELEDSLKLDNTIDRNWLNAFRRSSWAKSDFVSFLNEISPRLDAEPIPEDLAVCMSFFNPSNRKRPLQNILYCINSILNQDVPVYILELLYDGQSPQLIHFPNSYHIKSNSIMFHKENLWNILEKKVPNNYKKLLFLDGDVLFKQKNWPSCISSILNSVEVIQPFSTVELLDIQYRVVDTKLSCVKAKEKRQTDMFDSLFKYPTPGFGLACRREWLHKIGGFHEFCIMGGGDKYMITNICNRLITNDICYIEQPYAQEPYEIKKPLFQDVLYSSIDLTIQHLFHGRYIDRQYSTRHKKTKEIKKEELYRNEMGLIQFVNPEKWNPIILEYFNNRNDDGI